MAKLSLADQGAPPFIAASPPPSHAMLRGCGAWCACCEWGLACSDPASPLAHACALHLLCRDAGFLHDAGMMVLAGLPERSVMLLVSVRVRMLCEKVLARSAPASPLARACALRLLCCSRVLVRYVLLVAAVRVHVLRECTLASLLPLTRVLVSMTGRAPARRRSKYVHAFRAACFRSASSQTDLTACSRCILGPRHRRLWSV